MAGQTLSKRWTSIVLSSAIALSLVGCSASPAAPAPTAAVTTQPAAAPVIIKVASQQSPTHWLAKTQLHPWMDRVKELAGDKVKIEYYPSEQLGKASDMPSLLKSGVGSVAWIPPNAHSGLFPLGTVSGLPLYSDEEVGGNAYIQLIEQEGAAKAEWDNNKLHVLWCYGTALYDMWTAGNSVTKLEDVNGLKLRSIGGVMDKLLRLLGAVPVSMQASDIYTSLERGTIDGAMLSPTSLQGYKLDELVRYFTVGAPIPNGVTCVACSREQYSQWPAEVQAIVDQAGDEIEQKAHKINKDENIRLIEVFEKAGMKSYRLTDADKAEWLQKMSPVVDEWVSQMEGKGLPAKQTLDTYKSLLDKQKKK